MSLPAQRFPTKRPNLAQRIGAWLWKQYNEHHWLLFAVVAVIVAFINLWRAGQ